MASENHPHMHKRNLDDRYRLLIENIKDFAIYLITPEGLVDSWNPGAELFKGYTADEIIGQSFSIFYTEEDRAAGLPEAALRIAETTGKFESDGWRVCKDGRRFWAHVVIVPVRSNDGRLVGFAKITRDITVQYQTQVELEATKQALQRSQKLESLGKLTGGVAHDFNNILQVIAGNLQLLKDRIVDDLGAKRVEAAIEAVERGAKLSAQLLAFARRQPLQPITISPRKALHGIGEMLRRALGEGISVENVIGAGIWNISVDIDQLENVLINLAINARDAMSGHGKLTIEVNNAFLDDDYASKHDEVEPGQYVAFAISDTGVGMSPETLERACEPFYTTKREGEGTGLGLSMAFGFVKQSGGHFKIYSEVGQGTTVRMYFPRAFDNETQAATYLSAPAAIGGTETILVVEDDPAVQATAVDMLTSLGYRVLKADDATSALVILKSGIAIDVLFTDVVMPGELRSPELARQARTLIPGIEVLFTSGYTQNAIVHGGRLDPGVNLISKPYGREQLARKIRLLLAKRQQEGTSDSQKAESSAGVKRTNRPLRVLVVEDNQDTLDITCELLRVLGCETQGASTAEEAAQLFATQAFDILFTDFTLPGMNGVGLAKQLRGLKPDLRIVVASGYGNNGQFKGEPDVVFITKPYDRAKLEEVLAQFA